MPPVLRRPVRAHAGDNALQCPGCENSGNDSPPPRAFRSFGGQGEEPVQNSVRQRRNRSANHESDPVGGGYWCWPVRGDWPVPEFQGIPEYFFVSMLPRRSGAYGSANQGQLVAVVSCHHYFRFTFRGSLPRLLPSSSAEIVGDDVRSPIIFDL